jgi:hypothetical protein
LTQKPKSYSPPSMTHAVLAQPAYNGSQPGYDEHGQYQAYSPGASQHSYSPEMPASPVQRYSQPSVDGRGMSPGVPASPVPRPYGAPPQLGQYPPGYFHKIYVGRLGCVDCCWGFERLACLDIVKMFDWVRNQTYEFNVMLLLSFSLSNSFCYSSGNTLYIAFR